MSAKKNHVPLYLFVAGVSALVAFTLFDIKKAKQEEGLLEGEQKVLTLSDGEIVDITIKTKAETIEVKNDNGVWHLVQPLQDDVDDLALVGLLNAVKEAKVQKPQSEQVEIKDWKPYGLDPGVQYTIKSSVNKEESFSISDTSAYEGSFYIRKNDQLFVADRSLARLATKEAKELRSHHLWRTVGDILKIKMKYPYEGRSKTVILTKREKGWEIEPKFDLPLHQERTKDWLQSFRDMKAVDFGGPQGAKAEFIYDFEVEKDGNKSQVHWEISEETGKNLYVRSSALREVMKSSKFQLRDVRVPAEYLIDGGAVFDFPLEKMVLVRLTEDGKSSDIKKEGSETKLAGFIQKLKGLEPIAGEVPKELAFDSKNRLVIKGSQSVLLDMSWTAAKDQLRWLKISGIKERFKVSAERFSALTKELK